MKDTELIRSIRSGVAAVAYSFSYWVRCEYHADINDFCLISLDTSRVSWEEVYLLSFDVVICLLK